MVIIDDILVHFGTTIHVIGFDGQHFLQGVSCTLSFQRPNLHLSESLATKLRLAAKRLLGYQTVRPG